MILQALCGYYDRLSEEIDSGVAQPGYQLTPVSSCIILDKEGNVQNVIDMIREYEIPGKNGKKQIKRQPDRLVTPQQPKRSGKRPEPAFLCENAGFLFGIYKDKEGAEYRFEASRNFHERILEDVDDDGARAVLAFFRKRKQGTYQYEGVNTAYFDDGGNIIFQLRGDMEFLHDRPAIKAAWELHLNSLLTEASVGQCLVTGEWGPIARIHGNLNGFGQDKPTVVGFNKESFVSYRKEQGDNAPVSEKAAFKYVTALNMLINDRGHCMNLHGDKLLFWAERNAPLEEQAIAILMEGDSVQVAPQLDEIKSREIASVVHALRQGEKPEDIGLDPNVKFYLLGISANVTRAVIRYFYINTFGQFVSRLQLHHQDVYIEGPDWEPKHPSIYKILLETAVLRKSENVPAPHRNALIRSIFSGSVYPHALLIGMLGRIRAEAAGDAKAAINRTRVGVIKGCVNRLSRSFNNKELITVGLNHGDKTVSYLLGQLFALLEKAQYDALGKVNASIVDKYLNAALASPQQVFPTLLTSAEKHFAKSKKYYIKVRIRDIMGDIPSEGYPKTLNAEDQGRFMIGYYHQQQDIFTKKDKYEAEDNKDGYDQDNEQMTREVG